MCLVDPSAVAGSCGGCSVRAPLVYGVVWMVGRVFWSMVAVAHAMFSGSSPGWMRVIAAAITQSCVVAESSNGAGGQEVAGSSPPPLQPDCGGGKVWR